MQLMLSNKIRGIRSDVISDLREMRTDLSDLCFNAILLGTEVTAECARYLLDLLDAFFLG